jgi:hypothetical protein
MNHIKCNLESNDKIQYHYGDMQWVWNKGPMTCCMAVPWQYLRWTKTFDGEGTSEIPTSGSAYLQI